MKTQYISLVAIATLSLLASSCRKDEEATPSDKTKTELLTEGTWRFSKATSGGINISGFFDACQKDNIISFRSGGSGSLDEGTAKCDPNDPQSRTSAWNFAADESIIHVSTQLFEGGGTDFDLERLTASELETSQNIDIGNGNTQKVTVTFTH